MNNDPASADLHWMRRALRLARRGLGQTRPNPPVGAVLVSASGQLLGEGFHRGAGQPHAEIETLNAARGRAHPLPRHATLYVTLEPCSTHGRTPPCTDAIIRAGIARVVVACHDPNPRHAGHGLKILRDANIRVDPGPCEDEARELIAPFTKHILHKLPFVTLKLAMTLDGRIADVNAQSKWITGEKSRAYVQQLRRQSDALLVGANTILADDPGLLPKKNNPQFLRLILDPALRTPHSARVFTDAHAGQTLLLTASAKTARHTACGARVLTLQKNFSLRDLLHRLAIDEHLTAILCEGGGILAASLAKDNLVDRFELFYAPSLLLSGTPAFNAPGLTLDSRINLTPLQTRRFGDDTLLTFLALSP